MQDRFITLITDGHNLRRRGILERRLLSLAEAAPERISRIVLREQAGDFPASNEEVEEIADSLSSMLYAYGIKLIVNRLLIPSAQGIHLGSWGLGISACRERIGDGVQIGYSAHSVDELQSAFSAGADYAFLSPIFAPLSKKSNRPVLGVGILEQACASCCKEVIALGGVSASNAASCKKAGAGGVACLGGILLAKDPDEALKDLVEAWDVR